MSQETVKRLVEALRGAAARLHNSIDVTGFAKNGHGTCPHFQLLDILSIYNIWRANQKPAENKEGGSWIQIVACRG